MDTTEDQQTTTAPSPDHEELPRWRLQEESDADALPPPNPEILGFRPGPRGEGPGVGLDVVHKKENGAMGVANIVTGLAERENQRAPKSRPVVENKAPGGHHLQIETILAVASQPGAAKDGTPQRQRHPPVEEEGAPPPAVAAATHDTRRSTRSDAPDLAHATTRSASQPSPRRRLPAQQLPDPRVPATGELAGPPPPARAANPRCRDPDRGWRGEAPPPPAPHGLCPADALRQRRGGGDGGRGLSSAAEMGLP
nr:translation initiation factor IF-2-like [Aegilops tauschii subsp. strangulata]